ncbi:hypothetical protein [Vibrio mangrovi]|uniref:Uncharacterized protein n=1 Tax=Vibrio mangrovi TaxID=474394 RepID=A0A1Y6IUD5_9VIBR|nr:hypothetical protein [Vibrio mangrovi]MDW6003022.1 hypothetical protein [Vibrio mangrovi]SMS01264.1 hypothetical protein VIM7927_02546 [Vibrio mangrovi]
MSKIFISGLICLLFSSAIQASSIHSIDSVLRTKLDCKDRYIQDLCYLSVDQRNDELIIFMSSAVYRANKFIKKPSSHQAANLSHKIYWSVLQLNPALTKPHKVVLVLEVMYKDRRLIVIHDDDNTAHVELDKRIDIYQLLKDHRERVKQFTSHSQQRETLKKGESITIKYDVTNTYNVMSADAVKDNKTGKLTILSEQHKTGEKVSHTKTIHYMVLYPEDSKL